MNDVKFSAWIDLSDFKTPGSYITEVQKQSVKQMPSDDTFKYDL